jgi:diguanylate cyclase (GGDEF)-like protein
MLPSTGVPSGRPFAAAVPDPLAAGGDEFAAVLRGATPDLAQSLADGLCTAVREQSHAVGSSQVHASVSIGCAFLDAGSQTHHDALLAADTALNEAKVAGGDRAILHESSPGA